MLVFLFTDIEGSTRLWEKHTAVMTAIIACHDEILRGQVEDHEGHITKYTGDGITAVFEAGQPLVYARRVPAVSARGGMPGAAIAPFWEGGSQPVVSSIPHSWLRLQPGGKR